jgi:hypothetical protein
MLVDDRTIAAEMLIERDAVVQKSQQPGQPAFAVLDWLSPKVLTVDLKQIERAKHCAGISAMTADQIEHRQAIVVADDGFPSITQDRTGNASIASAATGNRSPRSWPFRVTSRTLRPRRWARMRKRPA